MSNNQSQGRNAAEGLGSSIMTAAQNEFNAGPRPYANPLYAGIGDTTKAGVNATVGAANAAQSGLQNAFNWNNNFLTGGGVTPEQRQAMTSVGAVANTLGQPSAAQTGFTEMYQSAGAPSLTESQLMSVARGEQFGQQAPGYARLREKALDDTLTGVGASFLTNGRYGSSVMGDAAGEAATGVIAGMDYQNYQSDIARQERALAAIEGQRQQGFNNRAAALGAADAARLGQTNAQLSALQSQFGMGQQQVANQAAAAAAMPGYAEALLMPGKAMTQAGQILDADAQARRMADYDLWTRQNGARTDQIAQFANILNGAQGMPGTEKETPWWQSLLGGAVGLAGAFL